MRRPWSGCLGLAYLLVSWPTIARAEGAVGARSGRVNNLAEGVVGARSGRVNNLKVLSDKIDDVTTVENILRSFVRPGMSDEERSRAIWTAMVKYRHQTVPPNEFLAADWEVHDPVKIFNVYGYCMCCCCSALIAALNRADGREARGRILNNHSVPEVRYGDAWHMFDASLIAYFPRAGDGAAASVDEIAEAVGRWHEAHPGYRKNGAKLLDLMRSDGWSGWKANGPELLAHCPFYDQGYLPARTHGWDATMVEYDRKSEVYEYGYQVGHRALFSLRPGESFVREAGNRGLHVNRETMPAWDVLKAQAPRRDLVYLERFFPGYRGGVVANGKHRYAPDLAAGDLAAGAEVYENLDASGASPALRVKEAGRHGVAVIPMISPYVDLGGRVRIKAVRPDEADGVSLALSTDNGRHFTTLWTAPVGVHESTIDLGTSILRRYACWLKVEIVSAKSGGAGLDALAIESDFQHAPRTLPWLGRGRNTINVAADDDPALATRTIACRITPDASYTKNETTGTLGATFDNLDVRDGSCWWKKDVGTLTIPVAVPGDLATLRLSVQARARGPNDRVRVLASTDRGQTWRDVGAIQGPTPGTTRTFRVADWPGGTRDVLLRFALSGTNTIGLFSIRIDADYRDPLAARGFPPVRVIHRWREDGRERTHAQDITALPSSYTIETTGDPEMISVTAEMPPSR
jgi:hypothetical protein